MSLDSTNATLHLTHAYCGHGFDCHCKCDDLPYRLRSGKPIPEDLAHRAADKIERLQKDQHSLRATIRRYRSAAKACGTISYMAEHPEEMEADHEPFV